jgi:hypothetical protein
LLLFSSHEVRASSEDGEAISHNVQISRDKCGMRNGDARETVGVCARIAFVISPVFENFFEPSINM